MKNLSLAKQRVHLRGQHDGDENPYDTVGLYGRGSSLWQILVNKREREEKGDSRAKRVSADTISEF